MRGEELEYALEFLWYIPENVVRYMCANPFAVFEMTFVEPQEAVGAVYLYHDREIPGYRLN